MSVRRGWKAKAAERKVRGGKSSVRKALGFTPPVARERTFHTDI